ncbi:threonine/serine exporter family protein [Actinomycetaceae bacterium L2_0104]
MTDSDNRESASSDPYRIAAHTRLAHQSQVVLRLGVMMLAAGASSFRVKDAMAKLAKAVGIEEHHAQVTYTEIVTTAYANGTFRTELAEQRVMGVNAERIDTINNFIRALPPHLLVETAERKLDEIAKKDSLYPPLLSALVAGVACAAFCFLNKGGLIECLSVLFAALFGQWLRKALMKRNVNHFGVWFACGAVSSAIYIAIVASMSYAGLVDSTHEAGVVSAILFLVPGFPMVTSLLDLIRQDFSAGISRGVYVVMLLASSAMSVWAVTSLLGWSVEPIADAYHLPELVLVFARAAATFVAAFGFAMLFNAPLVACALAAFNGAIVNTARLTAQDAGLSWMPAVGLAALAAGLLAHLLTRRSTYSRISLSVPAVVVMIPGVPLYRAVAAMNNGQITEAISQTVTIVMVVAAIGAGLAISRMLTDRNWLMEAPRTVPALPGSEQSIPRELRS